MNRSSMDILACIFAYLGCAAGIVVALAMWFAVVFATPDRPSAPTPNEALASQSSNVKTAAAEQAKLVPTVADTDQAVDRLGAKHGRDIREARQATEFARLRRLAHDEQARRWAYQQTPDFGHRFPSFTD